MVPPNAASAENGDTTTTSAGATTGVDATLSDPYSQTAQPAQRVQSIAMKLLDVTLQPSTAIITSVAGEFSAPNTPEVVCLKPGGTLELYQTHTSGFKLVSRLETHSILLS